MGQSKVDMAFVRESWEVPGHVSDYVDAVDRVGLWNAERLLVSEYFAKSDRILDIGCGAGRLTIALYRLGYRNVRGVDLSRGMIERAIALAEQAGYPILFEIGDATRLHYRDEGFDGAIFSAQGLMCIPGGSHRLQVLTEVSRVLRPGGHFIFTTHDREVAQGFAPFWDEETARWREGSQDPQLVEFGDRIIEDSGTPTFIHIPTRGEVMEMVRRSGLLPVLDAMRPEICVETEAAREFSLDSRMWVVQRPG